MRTKVEVALAAIATPLLLLAGALQAAAAGNEWPTLNAGNLRTGFNGTQTTLTPANAGTLHQLWARAAAGAIVDEPVIGNGMIYNGNQNGFVFARDLSGTQVWSTFAGQTVGNCPTGGTTAGVANTATVANPGPTSTLVVAGGDGFVYSLNAFTGAIVWRTKITNPPAGFLWGSPAVFGGSVYEGIASLQDCPLVRGGLAKLDLATGAIQALTYTVPAGCTGGSIWSSPAVDEATGTVFVTTGNPGDCGTVETNTRAFMALRASDLAILSVWQVPPSEPTCSDCDFGAPPTLFTATIGGQTRQLMGAAGKNGVYYALDRANLAAGPVWKLTIGQPGASPLDGDGSISGSAFDGTRLFIAGGRMMVGTQLCKGTLRSVNPATGIASWVRCGPAPVLASLSATPGLVLASAGPYFAVLSASNGAVLFAFKNPIAGVSFLGGTSISDAGVLYMGGTDGILRAFATA